MRHERNGKTGRLRIVTDSDFESLRVDHGYYADKTAHLEVLLDNPGGTCLFTRPQRFGKTLFLSTVASFLDISRKSCKLFKGLAISRNKALCEEWMNKYPIVELNMGAVEGPSSLNAIFQICDEICFSFMKHDYLLQSEKLGQEDKEYLTAVLTSHTSLITYQDEPLPLLQRLFHDSVKRLCAMLEKHHGQKPVLLLDEYDKPLFGVASSDDPDCLEQTREFLAAVYRPILEDNEVTRFALAVGCTPIIKQYRPGSLKNLKCHGVHSESYSDLFGLTDGDMDDLLRRGNLQHLRPQIEEWYDGYTMGLQTRVYCPWDVLNHVKYAHRDNPRVPQPYWVLSSHSSMAPNFLANAHPAVENGAALLAKGHHVRAQTKTFLSLPANDSDPDEVWSWLLHLGYLTRASQKYVEENEVRLGKDETALVAPNKCVLEAIALRMEEWSRTRTQKSGTDT